MDHAPLIAQTSHGPGMHGPVVMVLFLITLVGGLVYALVYLVKRRRGRTRSEHDPEESDLGPEA